MLPGWPSAPAKSSCCRSSSSAPPSPSGSRTASPLSAPSSSSSLPSSSWSSAGRRQSASLGRQRAPSRRPKSSKMGQALAGSLLTIAITLGVAGGVQCMPSWYIPRQPHFAAGTGRTMPQTHLGLQGVEADAVVALQSISSRLLRLRGGHEKECGCGQTANEWVTDQVGIAPAENGHAGERKERQTCPGHGILFWRDSEGDAITVIPTFFHCGTRHQL